MSKNYRFNGRFQRVIFEMFANEIAIRNAVYNYKIAGDRREGMSSVRGIVSNPTEAAALRRICEVKEIVLPNGEVVDNPERWLMVIEKTYAMLRDDVERDVLRSKVRGIYYVKVCRKNNISAFTFYNIVNKSYNFALAAACQLGLIKVI